MSYTLHIPNLFEIENLKIIARFWELVDTSPHKELKLNGDSIINSTTEVSFVGEHSSSPFAVILMIIAIIIKIIYI
jgi:hypothetical protein